MVLHPSRHPPKWGNFSKCKVWRTTTLVSSSFAISTILAASANPAIGDDQDTPDTIMAPSRASDAAYRQNDHSSQEAGDQSTLWKSCHGGAADLYFGSGESMDWRDWRAHGRG
jgi:hypothetical protein